MFSSEEAKSLEAVEGAASVEAKTAQPVVAVTADGKKETEASSKPDKQAATPKPDKQVVEQPKPKGEYYKLQFSKNVFIDAPDQMVFADELFITDILLSSGSNDSNEEPNEANAPNTDSTEAVMNSAVAKSDKQKNSSQRSGRAQVIEQPKDVIGQLVFADAIFADDVSFSNDPNKKHNKTGAVGTDIAETVDVPVPNKDEQKDLFEEDFLDIVITCDNGIFITRMNSTRKLAPVAINREIPEEFNNSGERPTFISEQIDYSSTTKNIFASGPSELIFYPNDVMGDGAKEKSPVKITAQEKTRFLPALNQVIFEGDSLCTALRNDPNYQQQYTLSAPRITVYLNSDEEKQSPDSATGIKHLTADGGVVQLATAKTSEGKLLGFTKLKCLRFDFDAEQQLSTAIGPGIIAVDNSKIPEAEKNVPKFGLRKQCYVLVQDFDTLKYFLGSNQIIADSNTQQIYLSYVPIIKGQEGQVVKVTASHIEADLIETATGQTEISTLTATGGVTYEEEAGKTKRGRKAPVQFVGSEFFYDTGKSMITARGNESQPCLLNGALVPGLEYNVKTGRIKTSIIGPGALRME